MGQIEMVLIKGLLFAVAAFALIKVTKTVLDDFWRKKFTGAGHNDKDFDRLIEEKKQMLRNRGVVAQLSGSDKKNDNPELELFAGKQDILDFFSNLRWGEGKAFFDLAQEFADLMQGQIGLALSCDQFLVSKIAAQLLKSGQFSLGKKRNVAMTLPQIRTLIMSALLAQMLVAEFDQAGPLSTYLGLPADAEKRRRLISGFFMLKAQGAGTLEQAVFGPLVRPAAELEWRKLLFTSEEIGFYFPHKFLEEMKNQLALIARLLPLPLASPETKEWAHHILGTNPSMQQEDIKKAFRQLAQERHPDKLPAQLIGPRLLGVANENFATLKRASDFLLKTS